MQIERTLSNLYTKYQTINANFSQGFKYNTFYKLLITVTETITNNVMSDSLPFSFQKSPITAVIDSLGGIVSTLQDLTLNGGNSTIPQPEGDTIEYIWKCESAISFVYGGTCICPVISSNINSNQLTIKQAKIQNLCKYTFAFSIVATSTTGNKRTSTATTEFVSYKASILSIYGKVVKGHMFNVKDIYFTTHITSTGPDTNMSFNWSLIQVESLNLSGKAMYTQKNTFICNFLKILGTNTSSLVKQNDTAIPDRFVPEYLTTKSQRILGLDAKTLTEKTLYTFAVSVNYPLGPSFEFLTYQVQQLPRQRIVKIVPNSGVGMETFFTLTFNLPKTTDVDKAQYQILRRDCPSSDSEAIPVTQIFGTTHSYTGAFSQGLKSCKYQVEITVRAIEFDNTIEMATIVTIREPTKPATNVVADTLRYMKSNSKNINPNQKLNMLGQISNINVTEPSESGKDSVNTMMDMITDIDKPSGGVRDLMSSTQLIPLFNSTASILDNLLTTQSTNVNATVASNVTSKISNYLYDCDAILGGTQIVLSSLNTLSSVVDIGLTSSLNHDFYKEIHNVVTKVMEMKLFEVMPGSIPFNISFDNIEIVIENSYVYEFDNSNDLATEKGSEMDLPGNMSNAFYNAIPNTTAKANNTVTIGTSMMGETFNPYVDMKTNTKLTLSSINNLSSSLVTPDIISTIYKDLGAGKLSNVVNTKSQNADIIELSFTPLMIDKNGNNKNLDSPIEIGKLPDGKKVEWTIPTRSDPNSSIVVPMYYVNDKKVWINEGCGISPSNYTDKVKVSCDNLGKQEKPQIKDINSTVALKMSTDLINDVLNVLKAGNYKMLYNFGAFLNASWEGYFVLTIIFFFLIFIGFLVWFLNKNDDWALFEERIITLEERYGEEKDQITGGVMTKVFTFYSTLRKKGMRNVTSNANEENAVNIKTAQELERKIPNGFSVLTDYEAKKLKRTYHFIIEHSSRFPNKFFFINYHEELCSIVVLRRLTQGRINDVIIAKPVTFWRILKVKRLS